MIILSILLIAMLLLVSLVVVECIFKPKWVWLNRITAIILIIGMTASLASGVAALVCGDNISDLKAESAMLMPYYNLVVETNDEYVRFHYYQRVVEYNTEYKNCLADLKNPWIGVFYPKDWNSEISLIDFALRTDSDNELNDYEDFYDEVPEEDSAG